MLLNFKTRVNLYTGYIDFSHEREREKKIHLYVLGLCPDVYFIQYSNSINMHEIHIFVFKKTKKKILDFNNNKNILLFSYHNLNRQMCGLLISQGIFILSYLFYPKFFFFCYLFLSVYLLKEGLSQ